ncbi:MAG: hypothetical protein ACT4N5_07505 [Nitrosopumilaceae archaeon]
MNSSMTTFACRCTAPKKHRLILDGGSTGFYCLDLCPSCYEKEEKKFLISEEELVN